MKIVIENHYNRTTQSIPLDEKGFDYLDTHFGFGQFIAAHPGVDTAQLVHDFADYLSSHHMDVHVIDDEAEDVDDNEDDLNDLGKSEDFKSKLSQPHAIFSVENSPYPDKVKIPQAEGKDRHEETVDFLRSKGEDAHSSQGHYGSPERSIIVFNPKNANAIKNIAHSFGQESWIHSNGKQHRLEMLHGPAAGHVFTGEGTELHQNKPQDYYSTLPDGTHFTHKINF